MRTNQKTISSLLIGMCLITFPCRLWADNTARFEKGAERCFEQYLQFAGDKAQSKDENSSVAAQQAAVNFRCTKRYEAPRPYALAAIASIDQRIEALKRKIRQLNKKAKKLMAKDLVKAAQILAQVADLQLKLNRLKQKKQQGDCPPAKTIITMVFENNSDYEVGVFLHNNANQVALLGKIASGRIGTYSMSLQEIRSYVGDSAKTVEFTLLTIINGGISKVKATMRLRNPPTKKPCRATARFELFNKTFPVPQAQYFVFGVQAGNSPCYYIGLEITVAQRAPCSFVGGGLDCSSRVSYHSLAGPFTKYEDAQRAFCSNITDHEFWQLSSCRDRYKWKGSTWYWGCEASVRDAINKYCKYKFG